jgi:hypothetical protein
MNISRQMTRTVQLAYTYLLTHGAETFSRSRQLCSHSRTSQHFMEPDGSIPYSHESSTGPYLEPDESNPISLGSRSSSNLSCDRSIASSKLSSPKSAILSFLLKLPVSSCFLQVIQQLHTSPSSPLSPYNLSFNDVA